ncbi:multiprotein-bridging factor 1 family protein [Nocardia amikacinitolerans]|uniref:helix-turn-helix domain-containing protein n=1 Tax=Nocardia amikacinitolerans TaxID=756689 RepID=UPI0036BDDEB9
MSTKGKRRYPPNKRLTWQRLQKGWSREELVHQIALSMKAHGETDTGLTADTARRWESGERWPEPRFRKHLVLVLGLPAADLGLLSPEELAMRPDELGHPGPEMLDELRRLLMADEVTGFGRKQFLTALLAAGLSPLAASSVVGEAEAAWHQPGKRRDPRAVAAYRTITATQREMYWVSEPTVLLDAALSHLRLGTQLLAASPETLHDGAELAGAVAETALLSARLAFFDIGHAPLAERCFGYAESAVAQCGDHALATMIAAHRAFLPGFIGNSVVAGQLLDVAHAHARYDSGPLLRSWLHCVTAEIHARTGHAASARERIRQAEDALGTGGTDSERLDFFDATRLAGFAGNVALLAGHHDSAARWLQTALNQLDPKAHKQRSVILFDLAEAHAAADADHAATIAQQACAELESTFYQTAYERIPAVQRALSGTRGGAELAQRANELRPLAAGS